MKDIASEKKGSGLCERENVMEFCNHPKSLTAEGDDLTYLCGFLFSQTCYCL